MRDQKPARFTTLVPAASHSVAPAPTGADQPLAATATPTGSSIASGPPLAILIAIFLFFCMIGGVGTTLLPRLML